MCHYQVVLRLEIKFKKNASHRYLNNIQSCTMKMITRNFIAIIFILVCIISLVITIYLYNRNEISILFNQLEHKIEEQVTFL